MTDLEVDMAVAQALGLRYVVDDGGLLVIPRDLSEVCGKEHFTCEGEIACERFSPSTDLNMAFVAAMAIVRRVWPQDDRHWILSPCVGWKTREWTCSLGDDNDRAFADEPALAVSLTERRRCCDNGRWREVAASALCGVGGEAGLHVRARGRDHDGGVDGVGGVAGVRDGDACSWCGAGACGHLVRGDE